MTVLLIAVLGFFLLAALYLATLSARAAAGPGEFLDAGGALPPWVLVFAGAGIVVAALGLPDHLALLAGYGLQYNQVAVALIAVALAGTLVQKRTWLAARLTGLAGAGDLLGAYYGSVSIRVFLLFVLFLFAIPLPAYFLSEAGALVEATSGGAVPAGPVIWSLAFFIFLYSAIGGWRGIAYVAAAQSLLVLVLIVFTGGFVAATFEPLAFLAGGIATPAGILADKVPGVIQFSAGIGKEAPVGGIWTTIAVLSLALSLTGIVLSPGFALLTATTNTKRGFAFSQVWMTAGLAAGALGLVGPFLAAEMAAHPEGLSGLVERLASVDRLAAVGLVLLLVTSLQLAIGFFAGSAANILTIELTKRFVLPQLDARGQRLAARIALAVVFALIAAAASFAPLGAAIFSSLTLSLSAQMLPALLGLCWIPWISRSGVLAGLVFGTILVVFTEPFGLVLFERLFIDLPWGRWPLTIHSAGWGLAFNFAACLLVSLFTRGGEEREHRQKLHDVFARDHPAAFGGRAARSAKWSLTLIWLFMALGPGAILGNTFFSEPVFAGASIAPGLPSLLVWQILFWFVGVLIVWWLAYQARMSVVENEPTHTIALRPPANPLFEPATPPWIARLLGRVTNQGRAPAKQGMRRWTRRA